MTGASDDIIVTGDRRYSRAFDKLLGIEGGYSNSKIDRGGETKFGISLRFLRAEGALIDLDQDGIADFDLDMDGDIDGADIRALTTADAFFLYHRCFWRRFVFASYPEPLGEAMFDQAVNGGATAAHKLLQRAINRIVPAASLLNGAKLVVDGAIGGKTRFGLDMALRTRGMEALLAAYRTEAKVRYIAIAEADPTQKGNLRGWLNRAAQLGK